MSTLDKGVKGLKIAWSPDLGYATADPQVLKITRDAVEAFSSLGASVEMPSLNFEDPEKAFSTYVGVQLAALLKDQMNQWGDKIDPGLALFVNISKDKLAGEYLAAWWELLAYWKKMNALFEKFDLLLTPTVAVQPFQSGRYGPREIAGKKASPLAWMAFTYPFNVTGQPAASVPCGFTDAGLPVGLQIVGKRFDDAAVLRAAAAFENVSPWADKYPAAVL